MFLASTIGQIAHPFYVAFAWVLAFYFSLVQNYVFAIAMLTITVMVIVFPITQRGARSMMRMQLLSPELKKIQQKYKARPGDTPDEKQANRQALNEEMMALYKEHGVSPTGGCLPMFLQFPIFLILYGTIEGLVHTTKSGAAQPLYIGHNTVLYHDIIAAHGHLTAFGLNLADSALTHGITLGVRIGYIALILVAIVLQYVQMKQASGRNIGNKTAQMQQMQQLQKIFPIVFAVIYIRIAAGVNIYFIVSSLFRIGQQEYLYRHDPQITESLEKLRARSKEPDPKVLEAKAKIQAEQPKGFRARLAALAGMEPEELQRRTQSQQGTARTTGRANGGSTPPRKPAAGGQQQARRPSPSKTPAAAAPARRTQPRAQGKRQRKPR